MIKVEEVGFSCRGTSQYSRQRLRTGVVRSHRSPWPGCFLHFRHFIDAKACATDGIEPACARCGVISRWCNLRRALEHYTGVPWKTHVYGKRVSGGKRSWQYSPPSLAGPQTCFCPTTATAPRLFRERCAECRSRNWRQLDSRSTGFSGRSSAEDAGYRRRPAVSRPFSEHLHTWTARFVRPKQHR